MGVLSWVVYWPENSSRPLFHVFRQLIICGFILLATFINPSLFGVTLTLLSTIEYSRRCSPRHLISLYFVFAFAFWFTGFLCSPSAAIVSPRTVVGLLFKTLVLYFAFIVDHLVSVRFGQTGTITLVTFPILLTGCCEVLGVIDPFGVCLHVSSFCTDYPDFTFLLFRLFGPAGASLLVAFLASCISQWRVARLTPRMIVIFLFEVLTVLMVVVSLARYFSNPRTFFVRTTVVYDAGQFLRRKAFPGQICLSS
jgi:hypothetical protein